MGDIKQKAYYRPNFKPSRDPLNVINYKKYGTHIQKTLNF